MVNIFFYLFHHPYHSFCVISKAGAQSQTVHCDDWKTMWRTSTLTFLVKCFDLLFSVTKPFPLWMLNSGNISGLVFSLSLCFDLIGISRACCWEIQYSLESFFLSRKPNHSVFFLIHPKSVVCRHWKPKFHKYSERHMQFVFLVIWFFVSLIRTC